MNKVCKRLLTFFLGIPLVFAIVYLDVLNHLPLNFAIWVFTIVSANELYNMFAKKSQLFSKPLVITLTLLLPVITYVCSITGLPISVTLWFLIVEIIFLMGKECLFSKTFENSAGKIVYSVMIIFYIGLFISFISNMTTLTKAKYLIILFLLNVFMCDSCAWFFGVLFGKNNRGFIAASPNKSIIGFFGGIAGSIFFSIIYKILFPEILTCSYGALAAISGITALAAIIGDLIESVLKRSCDVKDSGNFIPGRGGALDSIDSIIIAAPIFYIAQYFLF